MCILYELVLPSLVVTAVYQTFPTCGLWLQDEHGPQARHWPVFSMDTECFSDSLRRVSTLRYTLRYTRDCGDDNSREHKSVNIVHT